MSDFVIAFGAIAATILLLAADDYFPLDEFLAAIGAIAIIAFALFSYNRSVVKREAKEILSSHAREALSLAAEEVVKNFESSDLVVCLNGSELEVLERPRIVVEDARVYVVGSDRWYESSHCYSVVERKKGPFRALLRPESLSELGPAAPAEELFTLRRVSLSNCGEKFAILGADRAVECCFGKDVPSKSDAEKRGLLLLKECFLSREERTAARLKDGPVVFIKTAVPLRETL